MGEKRAKLTEAPAESDAIKYLYHASDGREIWLPFDPDFPCIYCEDPVKQLTVGGPAVCGPCDCGYSRSGGKWTPNQAADFYRNARKRLDALADAGGHATPAGRAALEEKL